MLELAYKLQLKKKYLIQGLIFFSLFMVIYTVVDGLNMPYLEMIETYGLYLVVLNIIFNIMTNFN